MELTMSPTGKPNANPLTASSGVTIEPTTLESTNSDDDGDIVLTGDQLTVVLTVSAIVLIGMMVIVSMIMRRRNRARTNIEKKGKNDITSN